ncbi:DUF58 domain-containing protein [Lachnospiraceae bacterium MD1]|jgi:hypothetical protein|uniref:DUF58 domain-containing protein n=1 Tax=Variimorphobacter saccharofermentans TaxID=2755051 RepID=A0A839JW56_9FIRM|nr:DUF58 domain-containing protein [Variimorphobacter saccharofermentans]MBB2181494.1 DUF58 domain-containing protein [Variimorphobacter saccharofermentans]
MLRNKLRYLFLLAFVGVLSILYNIYYMTIIFLTVAAMPLLMIGYIFYVSRKIDCKLFCSVHVVNKGEAIPISVQIYNPTIFPISNIKLFLTYKNTYSAKQYTKEIQISVDGRTGTSVSSKIYSDFAGNIEITLKKIRIYDYIKLFSVRRKNCEKGIVAVLPSYYELMGNNFTLKNNTIVESDHYSTVKSGDDPSEVFAIREYKEGDRLQRIHWKLSMKQNQLMIKEFSDPLNCSVLLFVNLGVPQGNNVLFYMDSILESALSLSYTLILNKQIHYLSWYDAKNEICRRIRIMQESELYEAMEGLLNSISYRNSVEAISNYLAEFGKEAYTDLFYITGELSEQEVNMLSHIRTQRSQIIYMSNLNKLSEREYMLDKVIQQSEAMGIGVFNVDASDIKKDMEQLRLE